MRFVLDIDIEKYLIVERGSPELVLGLLEILMSSKHGCTIPTLVNMGNSGLGTVLRPLLAKVGGSNVRRG